MSESATGPRWRRTSHRVKSAVWASASLVMLVASGVARATTNGYLICSSPLPTSATADVSYTCTAPTAKNLRILAYYTPPTTSGFTTAAQVLVDGTVVLDSPVFATGASATTVTAFTTSSTVAISGTASGEGLTLEVVDDSLSCSIIPLMTLNQANTPFGGTFTPAELTSNAFPLPQIVAFNGSGSDPLAYSFEAVVNGATLIPSGSLTVAHAAGLPYMTLEDNNTATFEYTDSSDTGETFFEIVDRDGTAPTLTVNGPPTWVGGSVALTGSTNDPSATVTVNGASATFGAENSFSFPFAGFSYGAPTITVVAADPCQNTQTTTEAVTVDNTEPQLTVTSPSSSTETSGIYVINQSSVTLTISYADLQSDGSTPGSGVVTSTIAATFGGASYTPTVDTIAQTATWTLTLADGDYDVVIEAADAVGNVATLDLNVAVIVIGSGQTNPVVTFALPTAGTTITADSLTAAFFYADPVVDASNIPTSNVHLYISSSPTAASGSVTVEVSGLNFDQYSSDDGSVLVTTVPGADDLFDGQYYLVATVTDNAGNTGIGDVGFVLDRGYPLPTVTFTSPTVQTGSSGLTADGYTLTQTITFGYTGPSGVTPALRVDDIPIDSCGSSPPSPPTNCVVVTDTTVTTSIPFANWGVHTLSAQASYAGWYTAEANVTLTLHESAPTITVTTPTLDSVGSFLGTTLDLPVSLTYSVATDTTVASTSISVNGSLVGGCDGSGAQCFNGDYLYPPFDSDGPHTLFATVTDSVGLETTKTFYITIDDHAPQVSLTCESASCINSSGFASAKEFTVNINYPDFDTADPGAYYSSGIATVEAIVDEGTSTEQDNDLVINDVTAAGQLFTFTNLSDGWHTFNVVATDFAGNVGSNFINFAVDADSPKLISLAPGGPAGAPTAYTNTSQVVTIIYQGSYYGIDLGAFTLTDNGTDITSSIVGTASDYSGADALGQMRATITFAEGFHTLVASLGDAAGVTSQATTTFWIDTTAPSGSFVSYVLSANKESETVTFICNDVGSGISSATLGALTPYNIGDSSPSDLGPFTMTVSNGYCVASNLNMSDNIYTLVATLVDAAGNTTAVVQYNVVLDRVAPALTQYMPGTPGTDYDESYLFQGLITNTNPTGYVINTTGSISLGYTYSDATSGMADGGFNLTIADSTPVVVCPTTDSTQKCTSSTINPIAMAEGEHTITATATDNVGNEATLSYTYLVDVTAPTVNLVLQDLSGNPLSQSSDGNYYVSTPYIQVYASGSDSGSGIVSSSIAITDATSTGNETYAPPPAAPGAPFGYTQALSLTETTHTISVTTSDYGNNVGYKSATVIYDTTPPTVTLWTPIYTTSNHITLEFTVSDTTTVDSSSISFAVSPIPSGVSFSDGCSVDFSTEVVACDLSELSGEATYTFTMTATDNAGNSGSATATAVYDHTAPHLTITANDGVSADTGGFLSALPASLTVSYSDAVSGVNASFGEGGTVFITVNGPLATLTTLSDSSAYISNAGFGAGSNTVDVYVWDRCGNEAHAIQTYIVDTSTPTLTISSPTGTPLVAGTTATIAGSATDAYTNVSLTVNGSAANGLPSGWTGGAFSIPVTLTAAGTNSFTIVATNQAGFSASATASFTQVPAPVVTIQDPSESTSQTPGPITVSAEITSYGPVPTITINGMTPTNQTGSAAGPTDVVVSATVHLHQPSTSITVDATDSLGQTGSSSETITVDPPTTTITLPCNTTPPPTSSYF